MASFLHHVVGSFSTGADGNPTVTMMDAAFSEARLPWRYVNCEVTPYDLTAAVDGARAMGWSGFNCSMPHKQTVLPMLGQLSRTASLCNAVNTVTRDETGWVGHNTDGAGFLASITALGSVNGLDALILGSGGAASAIAIELACAGVTTVHICSRNTGRAASLAQLVQHSTDAAARLHDWSEIIAIPDEVRLIVNATPVGSAPRSEQFVNVDWTTTSSNTVAADVIVNPTGTAFLRRAHHAGLTTVDGTGVLVNQAAENIRLWTGISVDTGIMRRALEASH